MDRCTLCWEKDGSCEDCRAQYKRNEYSMLCIDWAKRVVVANGKKEAFPTNWNKMSDNEKYKWLLERINKK